MCLALAQCARGSSSLSFSTMSGLLAWITWSVRMLTSHKILAFLFSIIVCLAGGHTLLRCLKPSAQSLPLHHVSIYYTHWVCQMLSLLFLDTICTPLSVFVSRYVGSTNTFQQNPYHWKTRNVRSPMMIMVFELVISFERYSIKKGSRVGLSSLI